MDLLSGSDHAEIRSAIHDVTDTFMKTPCILHKKIGSLDVWQEDRDNNADYTNYNLLALEEQKEYGRDWVKDNADGAENQAEIKLTLNFDDVDNLGLIDHTNNYALLIAPETDKIILRGKMCNIVFAGYDGPIENKPLLIVLYCNQQVDVL